MAAIFNGSTSDLSATVSSTPIDYPVLMVCRFKAADATHRGTLIALSDNEAESSLMLEVRGDVAGDFVTASVVAASGTSSAQSASGFTAGVWRYTAAVFTSPTSRKVLCQKPLFGVNYPKDFGTVDTTERAPGDWTHLSIGALYNGVATNRFNGRIENVGVYFGFDPGDADDAAGEMSGQFKVTNAGLLRNYLHLSKMLIRNANDYDDNGDALTANSVTFDPSDSYWQSHSASHDRTPAGFFHRGLGR